MSRANDAYVAEAAGRLFRAYQRQCVKADADTLFGVLNATHSLNDKLKNATGADFHQFQEFMALKALRNLTHHVEEVRANVRVVPMTGISDLSVLCILRRDQVERAIEGTVEKRRESTRAACATKFHWYGLAVNINPCLFNFMVHAYEMLGKEGVDIPEDAVRDFETSYIFESENGYPHFIDGRISSGASNISKILTSIAAEMPGV
ncbi:hypothetical protein HB779_07890 [Phyllobacterium sp. 628]|uniref:hypothetical protein n=1 Tax=Phyllobacterium sp. 628 TaxID=2718938 RepID=UPI001662310E|nr:hypothetical protein [Phyllobacterium sp. 628]QND51830.1 hypothetical protein HB779_07890 [Phyllobacterium sp. 628]